MEWTSRPTGVGCGDNEDDKLVCAKEVKRNKRLTWMRLVKK